MIWNWPFVFLLNTERDYYLEPFMSISERTWRMQVIKVHLLCTAVFDRLVPLQINISSIFPESNFPIHSWSSNQPTYYEAAWNIHAYKDSEMNILEIGFHFPVRMFIWQLQMGFWNEHIRDWFPLSSSDVHLATPDALELRLSYGEKRKNTRKLKS